MKTKMLNHLAAGAFTLAAGLITACAAEPPKQASSAAPLPKPDPDGQYRIAWPDEGRGSARYIGITLGPDVSDVCHLPKAHFEFDSAEPLPEDKVILQALADCLRPVLKDDVTVRLVGRADPRGTADYNQSLAQRRSARVRELLVQMGLPADRITAESTGALQAVGDQPMYSYGYDRRVDVVLVGLVRAPR